MDGFIKNIYRPGSEKHTCPCLSVKEITKFTISLLRETRPNLPEESLKETADRLISTARDELAKEKKAARARKNLFGKFKLRTKSSGPSLEQPIFSPIQKPIYTDNPQPGYQPNLTEKSNRKERHSTAGESSYLKQTFIKKDPNHVTRTSSSSHLGVSAKDPNHKTNRLIEHKPSLTFSSTSISVSKCNSSSFVRQLSLRRKPVKAMASSTPNGSIFTGLGAAKTHSKIKLVAPSTGPFLQQQPNHSQGPSKENASPALEKSLIMSRSSYQRKSHCDFESSITNGSLTSMQFPNRTFSLESKSSSSTGSPLLVRSSGYRQSTPKENSVRCV